MGTLAAKDTEPVDFLKLLLCCPIRNRPSEPIHLKNVPSDNIGGFFMLSPGRLSPPAFPQIFLQGHQQIDTPVLSRPAPEKRWSSSSAGRGSTARFLHPCGFAKRCVITLSTNRLSNRPSIWSFKMSSWMLSITSRFTSKNLRVRGGWKKALADPGKQYSSMSKNC